MDTFGVVRLTTSPPYDQSPSQSEEDWSPPFDGRGAV
jgi:hypothetical protein